MAETSCTLQIPSGGDSALTVGQEFMVDCQGTGAGSPAILDPQKAELRMDPADKYKLKLLSIHPTSNGAQLILTSYQVGNHQLKAVQLVDDKNSVVLGDLNFSVKSVINPSEPQTEPFGPRGPLGLSLPWWYYALWILAIVTILAFVFERIRRRWKKRKLVREMHELGKHQEPFPQFTQILRKLNREHVFLSQASVEASPDQKKSFLEDLEKSYRIFLGRSLSVPALQWSDRQILHEIRSYHRKLYDLHGALIHRLLQEFTRARAANEGQGSALQAKDCVQLLDLARKNADIIYVFLNKEAKS